MAHVNTAGLHIPIWLDAASPNVGWGQNALFPKHEGSFFGNLFLNPPRTYYCDGDGFAAGATGVVAGRIGAGGANAPYINPFGDGVLCKSTAGVVAHYSTGVTEPDGYSQLTYNTTWNNVVTVWRASTYAAVFDSGYKYKFFSLLTRANAERARVLDPHRNLKLAQRRFRDGRSMVTAPPTTIAHAHVKERRT